MNLLREALGFSVSLFWLFYRLVFRFLCQKTSLSRFWCFVAVYIFSVDKHLVFGFREKY